MIASSMAILVLIGAMLYLRYKERQAEKDRHESDRK